MSLKSSEYIVNDKKTSAASYMAVALEKLDKQIQSNIKIDGQYKRNVIIKSGDVLISNQSLDCEFNIQFDDDTQANSAEIIIYNITNATINRFKNKASITVYAGYINDTGVIFEGYITSKKTLWEGTDKITTIRALDDSKRYNKTVTSVSYRANTKASYILKDLCKKVGLPIAVFKTNRDYTYTDEVTVDGSLADNIKNYASICGVSAYVCKSKIYVRSLNDGDNTKFKLSASTGLLSVSEFEETVNSKEYGEETVNGFNVEMLLQHRLQTASIIQLDSKNYKGTFRVKEGTHVYSGDEFKTTAKLIACSTKK